eukprot:GHVU01150660.1.p1 GENE.GHVU01150660.1~~GHVU01150660.1.p1  ORF type:complete len:245 (+),score=21.03 GHVU01150660.1:88-822(+)
MRATVDGCYPPSGIAAMDETELLGMTVALLCVADGSKESPFVVLKKNSSANPQPANGESFPPGMIVTCSSHGWMTEAAMLHWLDSAWTNRPGAEPEISVSTPHAVLLLDGLHSHMKETVSSYSGVGPVLLVVPAMHWFSCVMLYDCVIQVLRRMQQSGTVPKRIPPGLTPVLQPLSLSPVRLFKEQFIGRLGRWTEEAAAEGGTGTTPGLRLVLQWVADSWEAVAPAVIRASFVEAGIVTGGMH